MARTKKRVPPVIAKIVKAVDDLSPAEAAEALQAAAADESSVENRVLLLQARIKLLQDSQKPKRPPRKRKPKPKPKNTKAEAPAKAPPKKEEATGKVTAIDLDNLGALFGAVESGAAEAEKAASAAEAQIEASPKQSGGIDFGEMDALLAVDDDGDSDAPVAATPSDETDTPPSGTPDKSDGAIQMPDLSALNDLGGADDAAEDDDDGSDDLSALMTSMSMNGSSNKPKDDKTSLPATGEDDPTEESGLPDLSALDALEDAPDKDTSDQDDLSALMDALSDDAPETGETDKDEPPVTDNAPELAKANALDDAQEKDTSEQDDLAALMDALSVDTPETGETDEDEPPVADNAPELAKANALDDAQEKDTSEQDDLTALMDALSDDAPETGETDEDEDAPEEIGDDISELMVALVDDDPDMQDGTARDEDTPAPSMTAPSDSDKHATPEDTTGHDESNGGNIMDLSATLSVLSDPEDPADPPEAARNDIPTDDDSGEDAADTKGDDTPVASEDHSDDTETPDYSEFEALMGAASQPAPPEEETASIEEPQEPQSPAPETPEPQSPPDAQGMASGDIQADGTEQAAAQPEAANDPDFAEFNALMAAANANAADDGMQAPDLAPAPEAASAYVERPDGPTPEKHDAAAADEAPETAEPATTPLPEPDATVPTEDTPAATDPSAAQKAHDTNEATALQTAQHVPGVAKPESTAASFAEGKKKATLDDLYNLFPKKDP